MSTGRFSFWPRPPEGWALTDRLTGDAAGTAPKSEITQLRPNAGVRGLISAALVQFQLSDSDPATRAAALASMARDGDASHPGPLRAPMDDADASLAAKEGPP